jgi:hypothetical protein
MYEYSSFLPRKAQFCGFIADCRLWLERAIMQTRANVYCSFFVTRDIKILPSYDRLVNNSKRSFAEMLCRASLGGNLVIQFTAYYMKKEIHVRTRLSNILVQKFFS